MKQKLKRSPFFYVGDKYNLLPEIIEYFPKKINNFIEPFTGGGSVFMNVKAERYLLNDIDKNMINLHQFLIKSSKNKKEFFDDVLKIINKYGLSKSYLQDIVPSDLKSKWKKTYYSHFNKIAYGKLKEDYLLNSQEDINLKDIPNIGVDEMNTNFLEMYWEYLTLKYVLLINLKLYHAMKLSSSSRKIFNEWSNQKYEIT